MMARIRNLRLKLVFWQMPDRVALYMVGLISFLLTSPFAFRDPDPHHDGIQYGAALGVSQGLQIQSEVFGQYGPITPWLQGFTLWLLGPELIWIRLLNTVLITATAVFMYLILVRAISSKRISLIVPLAWVASSPDWSIAPGIFQFWPWPSTIFGFFVAASLYLWIRSRDAQLRFNKFLLFSSGLLVGLSGFTRSQNALLLYCAISLVLLVIDRRNRKSVRNFFYFSLGTLASGGTVIVYLLINGSLDDFINQAIIGAANNYAGTLFNATYLWDHYYVPAILYVTLGFLAYRTIRAPSRNSKMCYFVVSAMYLMLLLGFYFKTDSPQVDKFLLISYLKEIMWVSPMLLSILAAVATCVIPFILIIKAINGNPIAEFSFESSPKKKYFAISVSLLISSLLVVFASNILGVLEPSRLGAFATLVIPLTILIFHLWKDVFGNSRPKKALAKIPEELVIPLATALVSVACITQIFPVHDQYHLWWASPIPIVSVLMCGLIMFSNRKAFFGAVVLISIISFVLGLIPWKTELEEPRVKLSNGSLNHMYVTSEREIENGELMELLGSVESNSATFYCRDGLVATWTGRYMASGPRFVDWAWGMPISEPKPDERIFLCVYDSMDSAIDWADQNGYKFGNGVQTNFSYFSGFYLVELIRKGD
jgi:hypothetical protein